VQNIGWGLLSLPRRDRGGVSGVVGFEIGDQRFELTFAGDGLRLQERPAASPVLVIRGGADAFASWLLRGASGAALERAGKLRIEGDAPTWKALARAFAPSGSDVRPNEEVFS
jgi:hypothetical protein